ncbi:MOSC domain-containing protein [Romeria aff. gracilis LEGE 07310]|uniref:MOSC domain-containing protein n=1 Tax=Vasconcelosia minhoensis LEGE 07310 TaxID=915328 RepID=A0A8J7AVF7_9CYAN|nr:MOSC domain-containing protein [Romeria gracilis]MBE9079914.1 MOSC domain-containing protein [Romeria aff. gracilis LEGE 07310]
MAEIALSELHIYPIKSAAGVELEQAQVEARGFQLDRRWMLVDEAGKFITQRRFPRMALIEVAVAADGLRVTAPGMPELMVAFDDDSDALERRTEVEVWGDLTLALSAGAQSQQWFSQFLDFSCQLVYMPDEARRPTEHGEFGPDKLVSFADAYPFLLISEASLSDLNQKLADPVPMNRFRPNLVIRGCEALAEDTWKQIRIGDIVFDVAKPCSRCSIPTVDQSTGERGKEPMQTLSTYRRWDSAIWFGQNLIQHGSGTLAVGDPVEVLSRK